MDAGLKGMKALITGGGQGIGLAISKALTDEGVDIAIVDRGAYPDSEQELGTRKIRVVGIQADVSNESDVIRMVEEATDRLGGLDLYVNNVASHWDEAALKLTAEGWQKTVATNLSACIFGCREVGRHFVRQQSGSILIIGSTASHMVNPGEVAYRVTKGALVPYMEGLSAEMAPHGVRGQHVNSGAVHDTHDCWVELQGRNATPGTGRDSFTSCR